MNSPLQSLLESRVIEDVIDRFNPTRVEMVVKYNNIQLINGVTYLSSVVASKPTVEIRNRTDPDDSFYTLIMTDPDCPSAGEPHMREHLHWLVTDIPVNGDASQGREVIEYESPVPEIGIHRYVFVLFRENPVRREMVNGPEARDWFNTRDFARDNKLYLLVAAGFFNGEKEPAPNKEQGSSSGSEKHLM